MRAQEFVSEKWSEKYKKSINCSNPRGFSQRAHCAGRRKNEDVAEDSLNEFAPGDSGDDDYDDNDDRSMEATFTIFSKGKAHTGTVIIFPGVTTDVEYHLNGKIYIKNDMDNVYDYDDFITDAADYIQEIIQLEGDGHHFVEQGVAEEQLDELTFKGSPCTKDCSGHRAGYEWSRRKGGVDAASWSRSFNNGAALFKNGY